MILKSRGFTLLELIVVIAIIGVLSVIALPTFKNALARANDTKIKQFALTLDKKNDITSKYDFEEGAGLVTKDSNIYVQNNLTIPGSGVSYSTDTYASSSFYSLYFDGTNYLTSQANTGPSLDNKSFSISFWFKMNTNADVCMIQKGVFNTREMISVCYYLDSIFISAVTPYSNFAYKVSPQQWHHFVMSFDSSSYLAVVYVDGIKAGQMNLGGVINNTNNYPLLVGRYPNGTYTYSGYIDDLRFYEGQVIVR
jgi:prepilin-type N-terminal cleavage/methylation domain-containing protein